jgi:hypothetical protein
VQIWDAKSGGIQGLREIFLCHSRTQARLLQQDIGRETYLQSSPLSLRTG